MLDLPASWQASNPRCIDRALAYPLFPTELHVDLLAAERAVPDALIDRKRPARSKRQFPPRHTALRAAEREEQSVQHCDEGNGEAGQSHELPCWVEQRHQHSGSEHGK